MDDFKAPMLKEFYDLVSVSEEFGINIQTLRKWVKDGTLKASKVGTRYMTSRKYLNEYLDNHLAQEVPCLDFLETLTAYEVCQIAAESNGGIFPDLEQLSVLQTAIEKAYQLGYKRGMESAEEQPKSK